MTRTPESALPISDSAADRPSRAGGPVRDTTERIQRSADWVGGNRSLIVGSDIAVVVLAVLIASFISVDAEFSFSLTWASEGSAFSVGGLEATAWLALLALEGVWNGSVLTNRTAEVRRISVASLMVFTGVGFGGYLTGSDLARPYLLIAAPAGIAGLVVNRWYWRRRFVAFQQSRVDHPRVVVRTDLNEIAGRAAQSRTGTVAGRSLLVSERRPSGGRLVAKKVLDLTVAAVGILLLSPLLFAAAVLIPLADGGPVFHQEECVGRAGKVFRCWTFRCTPYGPKARPTAVWSSMGDARRPEYDLASTSVGRLLRRTGLALAPLLFAVLAQNMSIVGPKPVTPENFSSHQVSARPGVTGQWRVAACPVDGVDAELDAVENWSLVKDLKIITRTLRLCVTGRMPL